MKSNILYRVITESKSLLAIKEIEFSDFNFKERYDIQEWIESNPSILGEDLLIISKENSFFDNTRERPDLIALDKEGNIVVIELKRDDSGTNLEWQAIKYASYLSRFSLDDIIDMTYNYYSKNIEKSFSETDEVCTHDSIKQRFQEFIDEDNLSDINNKQRIILVSHRFAKEVTSAVNWLIEKYSIAIKCVQIIPFYDRDKDSYYIQSSTILPVAGIDHLLISALKKQEKIYSGVGPVKKDDEITAFFFTIYEKLKDKLGSSLPDKKSRWAGVGDKYRYFHLWYTNNDIWDNWGLSYRIWMYNEHPVYKSDIVIRIGTRSNFLLSKGVSEDSLNDFKDVLKKVQGFKYFEYNKNFTFGIEKSIANNEKTILDSFTELVETTKPLIDNVIDKLLL